MSEMINNREYRQGETMNEKEGRQKILKELIMELHSGKSVEEVKGRFANLIDGVSPGEISEMEQGLIREGMPVREVQRLCDVHAAVFKGSIEQIHQITKPEETPGHPIHTFKLENREIEKLIDGQIKPHIKAFEESDSKDSVYNLIQDFNLLLDIDRHYSRKENLVFPYLEKNGITAPPKVMWGVDDEIRAGIKGVKSALSSYNGDKKDVVKKSESVLFKISEMIFKEENILFPMTLDTFTEDEWMGIYKESDEIGYCLTQPAGRWIPERVNTAVDNKEEDEPKGTIRFETGVLSTKELSVLLNTLPVDITFIDKDDVVQYFSQSSERIFARTKAVIGRKVQNCHPPASVNTVERILEDFKSGKKDHEDFWIKMKDLFVYIRYFAVRDEKGEYMGTMEVTQNIKPIQEIEGEKRLLS